MTLGESHFPAVRLLPVHFLATKTLRPGVLPQKHWLVSVLGAALECDLGGICVQFEQQFPLPLPPASEEHSWASLPDPRSECNWEDCNFNFIYLFTCY